MGSVKQVMLNNILTTKSDVKSITSLTLPDNDYCFATNARINTKKHQKIVLKKT
jgi:hypothetical protein